MRPSACNPGLNETGNEVDDLAREFFPGGIAVGRGEIERTGHFVDNCEYRRLRTLSMSQRSGETVRH